MRRRIGLAVVAWALAAGAAPAEDRPTPAGVLIREGKKLRDAKDLDGARQFFEAAVKVEPGSAAALAQLAWVHNELGEYEKGVAAAQAALKIDPDDADALCELGYAQLRQKLYLRAVNSLRKAIEKDPRAFSAYGYLAEALRAVGEDEEAAEVEALKKKRMEADPKKD